MNRLAGCFKEMQRDKGTRSWLTVMTVWAIVLFSPVASVADTVTLPLGISKNRIKMVFV